MTVERESGEAGGFVVKGQRKVWVCDACFVQCRSLHEVRCRSIGVEHWQRLLSGQSELSECHFMSFCGVGACVVFQESERQQAFLAAVGGFHFRQFQ